MRFNNAVVLHRATYLALALAASFSVFSACTSLGTIDEKIKENLATACAAVEMAHETFLGLISVYPVKASIVATEKKAHDDAKVYCDHPENANTMSAVIAVFRLGATIAAALREAEVAEAVATP